MRSANRQGVFVVLEFEKLSARNRVVDGDEPCSNNFYERVLMQVCVGCSCAERSDCALVVLSTTYPERDTVDRCH